MKTVHRDRICCIENKKHCHCPGLADYLDDTDEANQCNSNHVTDHTSIFLKSPRTVISFTALYNQRRLCMPASSCGRGWFIASRWLMARDKQK